MITTLIHSNSGHTLSGAKANQVGTPMGAKRARTMSSSHRGIFQAIAIFGFWAALSGCVGARMEPDSVVKPKRVAIVLTNHGQLGETGRSTGFFLSEATHPYEVFRAAGYAIDFVSPRGGVAPMDGIDRRDPINAAFLDDPALVELTRTTTALNAVDATRYDAIFFAGGHGTMWDLPDNPGVHKIIRTVYERGGVVAAVCHGPAALVNVRLSNGAYLVAGKEVSAFTDEEEVAVKLERVVPFALEAALRARGARFVEAPNFERMVAVSGRLVTGQNPASATGVAEMVVKLLGDAG